MRARILLALGLALVAVLALWSVADAVPPPASEQVAGMLLKCRTTAAKVEPSCPSTVKRPLLVTCSSTSATAAYFGDSNVATGNSYCIGPSTICGTTYFPVKLPIRQLWCVASAVTGVRCICEGGSS